MQKIINVLDYSFVVSAAVVGGGAYVYLNKDAMIESVKEKVTAAATEAIAGALPGMMDAAMPELPEATGGVIPMGEGKGGAIPGMHLMNFDLSMEDFTIIQNALHYYKKVEKKGHIEQYDIDRINRLRDKLSYQMIPSEFSSDGNP